MKPLPYCEECRTKPRPLFIPDYNDPPITHCLKCKKELKVPYKLERKKDAR